MFQTSRPLFRPHPRIRPLENLRYPSDRATADAGVPLFIRLAVRLADRPVRPARAIG
jgi:hypothetical protein